MVDWYSIDGIPSDILSSETVGERRVKVEVEGDQAAQSLDDKTPDLSGAWGYLAGVSGAASVPADKRVLQISASAGATAASYAIDGGDAITIPAGKSHTFEPRGNLVAPAIIFTNTDGYTVEFVG